MPYNRMDCANLSNQVRNRTRKASYSFIRDKATLLFCELEFPSECPECPCDILHVASGLEQLVQQFFHVPGCLRSVWWWRETLSSPDAMWSEPRGGTCSHHGSGSPPQSIFDSSGILVLLYSCKALSKNKVSSPLPHSTSVLTCSRESTAFVSSPTLLLPESQGSLDYPLWLLVGKVLVFSCTRQTTLATWKL